MYMMSVSHFVKLHVHSARSVLIHLNCGNDTEAETCVYNVHANCQALTLLL